MDILELKDVSFSVAEETGGKEIVKNVDLAIPQNRLIAVTGPNGGGKSTLAKLIAGIEKASGGSIYFKGEDITKKNVTERARMGIGYAFQQPVRFKGIRVIDLLRIAAGKPISVADACEFLSAVGLCARDYIDREVNASLSGGELKRIEIATLLARKTELAVFDEPEAGIDLWSFSNLIDVFVSMRKRMNGGSIIIISHQERILNIADEIVVLQNGEVTCRGSRDEVMPALTGTAAAVNYCQKIDRQRSQTKEC